MPKRPVGQVRWLILGLGLLVVAVGLALAVWVSRGAGGTSIRATTQPSSNWAEAPKETLPTLDAFWLPVVDTGTMTESVEAQARPTQVAPAAGGRAESSRVQENVEFIIQDGSGTVKEHQVIGK